MNRNLLLFAFFLIVLGVGFGFYLLSILGVIMIIPGLLAPTRPVQRPAPPAPTKQETRRIIPVAKPASPQTGTELASQGTQMSLGTQMYPATQTPVARSPNETPGFSPALFPNPILPYLSISGTNPIQPAPSPQKAGERDELVEAGGIIVLLKLLLS